MIKYKKVMKVVFNWLVAIMLLNILRSVGLNLVTIITGCYCWYLLSKDCNQ